MWKPAGIHRPTLVIGLFEVGLVIVAGLVYFWGQWAGLYRRNFSVLTIALTIAGLLGLAAIGFHIYELHDPGYGYITGPNGNESLQTGYSSVFTVMEGVFTALLVPAVIVLLGLANRARLGRFNSSGIAVEAFGEFWGFLSAVALLNFLALYVQPFFPSA
jgi:heme/copper-type cytochrome/quinol oxidase subunit 3